MTEFRTLMLDPPWNERGGGKIKRGADRHYPLLKTQDMPDVIRGSGLWTPAENAHCYMWVTNTFLQHGLWLLDQLGFRYVTNVVWTKPKIGIGQYFRGKHELMLFGVRGKGKDPSVYTDLRNLPSHLDAEHVKKDDGKIKHSGKPACFYDLIEARSKGPYVEFFARSLREGWTSWGNEVPAFQEAVDASNAETEVAYAAAQEEHLKSRKKKLREAPAELEAALKEFEEFQP
jgi:N6-adenosine-specific RNA methylase IME4